MKQGGVPVLTHTLLPWRVRSCARLLTAPPLIARPPFLLAHRFACRGGRHTWTSGHLTSLASSACLEPTVVPAVASAVPPVATGGASRSGCHGRISTAVGRPQRTAWRR